MADDVTAPRPQPDHRWQGEDSGKDDDDSLGAWRRPLLFLLSAVFLGLLTFVVIWLLFFRLQPPTAFLGTQGDPWDTQWDIFMCTCGAILALLLLRGVHDRALERHRSGD